MQRSADSAALAAAWELIDEDTMIAMAHEKAGDYVELNSDGNTLTLALDDVDVGYLDNPSDPSATMTFFDPSLFNSVRVQLRRTDQQNGEVPLFFARLLGSQTAAVQVESTASMLKNIRGFRSPSTGENLGILPLALDQESWVARATDDWSWVGDDQSGAIAPGPDGKLEVNLYPQGTGSPGNRGTVDIGSNNNSTADLSRQILNGPTAADLAFHGGELTLDAFGLLYLNGDTGISAGVQDELAAIMGMPRIIPIFSQVVNPGNNATYTIVEFVGIRIVDVQLTGPMNQKRVIVQPANVITRGAIAADENTQRSEYIFSPAWLVR